MFERIENFFRRLETYVEVPPTAGMTDIIVKIMVEVLSILSIATKEIGQSRASKPITRVRIEHVDLRLLREIREEARWEDRHRGRVGSIGSTYAR